MSVSASMLQFAVAYGELFLSAADMVARCSRGSGNARFALCRAETHASLGPMLATYKAGKVHMLTPDPPKTSMLAQFRDISP